MMKLIPTILFILSLVLSSQVLAAEPVDLREDLVQREGLWYKKFSNVPYTGKVEGSSAGRIKKGKKVGSWAYYHLNGQLAIKGDYLDDGMGGIWKYYHEEGWLLARGSKQSGKYSGMWEAYDKNQDLKWEMSCKNLCKAENGKIFWDVKLVETDESYGVGGPSNKLITDAIEALERDLFLRNDK